jgi:hypothetical protein
MSGTGLTLLLASSFGVGHLVQEFGDHLIKTAKGDRYLRARIGESKEEPEKEEPE